MIEYVPRASEGTVKEAVRTPLVLVTSVVNGAVGETASAVPYVALLMKKLTVEVAPKPVTVKATPATPTGAVLGLTVKVEVAVTANVAALVKPTSSVTVTV